MEKSRIETFIKKYHLNGTLDQVRWLSKNKTLSITAMTGDRKFMTQVVLDKFDAFDDVEIGVLETSMYIKMLNVVGGTVSFDLNRDTDNAARVTSVVISDSKSESSVVAGDLDVIPESPKLRALPPADVEIKLSDDFISRFLKAKSALAEVDLFTLVMSKKRNRLEMVLGYSTSSNINRISLEVETIDDKNKITKPISFSAKNLKEIISANSECKDAVLKISEQGLAYVEFTSGDIVSKYYMIKVDVED